LTFFLTCAFLDTKSSFSLENCSNHGILSKLTLALAKHIDESSRKFDKNDFSDEFLGQLSLTGYLEAIESFAISCCLLQLSRLCDDPAVICQIMRCFN
jgi:hypothetical protein